MEFDENLQTISVSGIVKENTRLVHVNNRAEDQKQFYESILNNIPVDIAIFNSEHKYLYLNPVAVQNQEVRDFLLGRDDFDYCAIQNIDTSKARDRRSMFIRARESKQTIEFEDISNRSDGTLKYVSRRFVPVLDGNNEFAFMLGYGVDITPIKEHELMLGASLHEKELLLGEIHHSVKNNLTLIVALLEINSTHEKDDLVRKYFNEIRNRISALALIYDKLYRSEVFNRINLREYINALVNSRSPRLSISFKRESDTVMRLVVADNGPGLPEGVEIAEGKTFGFKLISLFTRQLKGKLNNQNSFGLRVDIEFQNMAHEVKN